MFQQAFKIFGKHSFQHAIFYNNNKSLRFELAEGGTRTSRFISALEKSMKITKTLFHESKVLSVCLAFPGNNYLTNLSVFRNLSDLEIKIPSKSDKYNEWIEDDEWNRNYIFYSIKPHEIEKYLFGKLGAELGVSPSFWFDLYIFDTDLGVLVHPYDDRGMDVVGPNQNLIKSLYDQYSSLLLNHDKEIMDNWFDTN